MFCEGDDGGTLVDQTRGGVSYGGMDSVLVEETSMDACKRGDVWVLINEAIVVF